MAAGLPKETRAAVFGPVSPLSGNGFFACGEVPELVGIGLLQDRTMWTLEQAIGGVARRHEALLDNVANVETPGYARRDVAFRDALRAALGRTRGLDPVLTDPRHIGPRGLAAPGQVEPRVVTAAGWAMRGDGNGVSLDHEMAVLTENALEYQ